MSLRRPIPNVVEVYNRVCRECKFDGEYGVRDVARLFAMPEPTIQRWFTRRFIRSHRVRSARGAWVFAAYGFDVVAVVRSEMRRQGLSWPPKETRHDAA